MSQEQTWRIGIDVGGTKIAGTLLGPGDIAHHNVRCSTPQCDYSGTLEAIRGLVTELKQASADALTSSVGIGIPGSESPLNSTIQNANSTWLNGRPFRQDLSELLAQPVRLANDANCFALSEAMDGNARDAGIVFGVILGTGCGGGIVIDGRILNGPRGIGGEWGHTPLPAPTNDELPGPRCWCGRNGCMETWVSGTAVAADHRRMNSLPETTAITAETIAEKARMGEPTAVATLTRLMTRLARGLAGIINVIDPDVIVLGGGLSSIDVLYEQLPSAIRPHIFADDQTITIRRPHWGAASGVRGAARLWP